MANYVCDEGDGPAHVTISLVETGDVTMLCTGHFEAYCKAFVESFENARAAAEEPTDHGEAAGREETFREATDETPQEPPTGDGGAPASE